MLTFWIAAVALSGLALAFVLPPLLKKNVLREEVDRKELNIGIYRERLGELRQDLDQGNLTPERFEQAKEELEKSLLSDLHETEPSVQASGGRWAALAVALLLPLLALGGYWFSGDAQRAFSPPTAQAPSLGDLESMVARLAQRLETEPDNTEGWIMLARSYRMLDRHAEAAGVYARLLDKAGGQDPDLLTDYAEALALADNGKLAGKPVELLNLALSRQADSPKALWLSGMAAAQAEDYPRAVQLWEKLLGLLPANDEDAQTVQERLTEARQLAGLPPATPTAVTEETGAPDQQPAGKLEVRVSLSPELQAKLNPEDTLFVYARAAEGPRMPLAIVKKQAGDLPLSVILDDSMSMMPQLKLSSVPALIAAARISPSGQATLQPGDWLGESGPLAVKDSQTVEIVINQVISE